MANFLKQFDDYYKQLEGYTFDKFLGVTDEDFETDGFPQFRLTKAGHETIIIEVSRDPEGNGGGFLFIGGNDEKEPT
jgi:hypothetical protein|tara:strand:- start:194 stop:424 length:231 start_codon:yes stop_codon:yes gene_type:complete